MQSRWSSYLTWTYSLLAIVGIGMVLGLSSCGDEEEPDDIITNPGSDDPKLVIEFQLLKGDEVANLDEGFTDVHGQWIRPTLLKFFLSDLALISSGSRQEISDVELVDLEPINPNISNPQWDNLLEFEMESGDFEGVEFSLGVKPALNNSEPIDYENEHPLSVFSGTYWTWATMYRFVMLEARGNAVGNSDDPTVLVYHTGTDTLFGDPIRFAGSLNISDGQNDTLRIGIDLETLFDPVNGIDMTTDANTHTVDSPEEFETAKRFTEAFKNAMRVVQ